MPDRSRNLQKRQNETLVNVSLKKRIKKISKFRFETYYQSKYPKPNPTKKDKRNVINVSLKKNKKKFKTLLRNLPIQQIHQMEAERRPTRKEWNVNITSLRKKTKNRNFRIETYSFNGSSIQCRNWDRYLQKRQLI